MKNDLRALIFDVDGTIADTERYGHLPASNDAMRELGLDIQWQWEEYREWLDRIPGNVNRLVHSLKERHATPEEIEKHSLAFAPLKKKIYIENYLPKLRLRSGIAELMEQAVTAGLQLAIVSTSYESQIAALLEAQLPQFYPLIRPIMGKESGMKTESDGYLHKKCLAELGISPSQALVIEDAQNGLDAARCAGISTAVFYNDYTFGSSFHGARLVAPSARYFSLQTLIEICLN